jgi:hypothetical protein
LGLKSDRSGDEQGVLGGLVSPAGILLDYGWGRAAQPVTSGPVIVEIVHRVRDGSSGWPPLRPCGGRRARKTGD